MRIVIVVGILALTASLPTYAQYANFAVYDNPAGDGCGIANSGPGMIPFYVVVESHFGLVGTQFTAPVPSCLVGASWLSDNAPFPVTIGSSQTGITIGFGACRVSTVHVLTINVQVQGSTQGCCRFALLPHPEATLSGVEFVDCEDNLFTGVEHPSFVTADGGFGPPVILDRDPPDGAADQPLDKTLNWRLYHCSCALGVYDSRVYFGTDSDPPLVAEYIEDHYDPGPLQRKTTYYWKLVAFDSDALAGTTSPIWSFTTTKGVPVEPSTWGRIKGLYED